MKRYIFNLVVITILIPIFLISCVPTEISTPTKTKIQLTSTPKPPTRTPSAEFITMILNSIKVSNPNISHTGIKIPIAIFANGAKVTIGADQPITFGPCVFISDPEDQLEFRGSQNETYYEGGTGAVICYGKDVYLYKIYLPIESSS